MGALAVSLSALRSSLTLSALSTTVLGQISVIPLQHGLTGSIEVEVERVAPVKPQDTLTAMAAGAPPGAN